MRSTPHRARVRLGACFLFATLALSHGCDRPAASPEAPEPAGIADALREYTVRGQVVMVPDASSPMSELQIRHEHIPDFVGWDGRVHTNTDGVPGMKPMTMPFPVKDAAVLEGLRVGDKVEFTFVTDLNAKQYWLTSAEKLSPDATLDFGLKATGDPSP